MRIEGSTIVLTRHVNFYKDPDYQVMTPIAQIVSASAFLAMHAGQIEASLDLPLLVAELEKALSGMRDREIFMEYPSPSHRLAEKRMQRVLKLAKAAQAMIEIWREA